VATPTAAEGNAPERALFVRKATGLVKGWSILDAMIYAAFAVNIVTVGFGFAFPSLAFLPSGSVIWATIIAGLFLVFEVIVYASLISVMPRAGGDYLWQSRIFGGGVGFILGATGWWFILWHWVPIYAQILAVEVISPILSAVGFTGTAAFHSGWWAYSATNGWGIFVTCLITAFLGAVVVAIGMRRYAVLQKFCFWCGMAGLAIVVVLFLVHSQSDFRAAFDRNAQANYGTGPRAYAATVAGSAKLHQTSFAFFSPFVFGATFLMIPFVLFWNLYPNWGATLYGEVKGASDFRKNIYTMGGGLLLMTVLAVVVLASMAHSVGYNFFGMLSASYYGLTTGGAAIFPYPGTLAGFFFHSAALQVILLLLMSTWFFGWLGTLFLSSTRMVFAAAFDRILPEWVAKVDERSGVPVRALMLMLIPSIPISAAYSFSSSFYGYTLDAAVVIAIMYFVTTLAAIALPWRRRDIYRASPIARYEIMGIPLVTFSGVVFLCFLGFALVKWLTDDLYGVNHSSSLLYMAGLYVLAAVIFGISRFVRKREGIDLKAINREIPVD
jgi:basic amino acid/polyamine antiporter, APA family